MSKPSKKLDLTAVVFRNIFSAVFTVLLLSAVALAAFGTSRLQTTAADVRTVVEQASTIDQTNTRTVALWNELQRSQKTANKANQVVADSKSYAYQDVIVADLKSFANKAGIVITNYDFTTTTQATAQPSSTPPQEGGAAVGAQSSPEATVPTPTPAVSLKTTSVSISLETPVNYGKLLTFIHYIEQNLTKMQISKVSLSRVAQDDAQAVNSDALSIEVYIR